jgi:predicted Fe-S protein YdhL (DUF1289 family)
MRYIVLLISLFSVIGSASAQDIVRTSDGQVINEPYYKTAKREREARKSGTDTYDYGDTLHEPGYMQSQRDREVRKAERAEESAKSLSDMSPDERRAYWENLPDEDKARIMQRRQALQAERMSKAGPATGGPMTPAPDSAPVAAPGMPLAPEETGEKAAEAAWEAMTPDEKRAFIQAHRADLLSGSKQ